jgi:hypothetical protein
MIVEQGTRRVRVGNLSNTENLVDRNLEPDNAKKLNELTERPDIDLHVRIQEHRIERFVWCQGRRYRLLGIRDEEEADDTTH